MIQIIINKKINRYKKVINNQPKKKKSLYNNLFIHQTKNNPEMNQFYDIIESTIHDRSTELINNLINKLN